MMPCSSGFSRAMARIWVVMPSPILSASLRMVFVELDAFDAPVLRWILHQALVGEMINHKLAQA